MAAWSYIWLRKEHLVNKQANKHFTLGKDVISAIIKRSESE